MNFHLAKANEGDLTGNPQVTFFKLVYRRHTSATNKFAELQLQSEKLESVIVIGADFHILQGIKFFHPDPEFSVDKFYASIAIQIGDATVDRIEMLENDVFETSITRNAIEGTCIQPWFWFSRLGTSLPLCSLAPNSVKIVITWKRAPVPKFLAFATGFNLDSAQELQRFQTVSQKYLIELRQPFHRSSSFSVEHDTRVLWMPNQRHRLFGKQFCDSIFMLLCCLRRLFGLIDRNIRNRIVAECANACGAPVHTFVLDLVGWEGPTKAMRFLLFDAKKCRIGGSGVYSAALFDDVQLIATTPGLLLSKDNVWAFAAQPHEHQPTGHMMDLQNFRLRLQCDARVESVVVQGWKYGVTALGESRRPFVAYPSINGYLG